MHLERVGRTNLRSHDRNLRNHECNLRSFEHNLRRLDPNLRSREHNLRTPCLKSRRYSKITESQNGLITGFSATAPCAGRPVSMGSSATPCAGSHFDCAGSRLDCAGSQRHCAGSPQICADSPSDRAGYRRHPLPPMGWPIVVWHDTSANDHPGACDAAYCIAVWHGTSANDPGT